MNSYHSSLTNTYSDRQSVPLSRSEHTAIGKENRPVNELVREGQQLRGEIINRTATDVTIRLSGGQTLQARLDVSVPLSIGQMASFEVTHADSSLISLRILQDEAVFAQNALIQKALTAAELPVTARNAELVNTLLQHNLPISKESIQSLMRQSNTFPNADIHTLALMTQHKIPITQATLTQFEAYQNYEHQILPQLTNLAQSLSELAYASDPALSGLTQLLQHFSAPAEPGTTYVPAPSETLPQAQTQTAANDTLLQTLSQTTANDALSQILSQTAADNILPQNPSLSVASDLLPQNLSQTATGDMLPQNLSQTATGDMLPQNLSQTAAGDMLPQNLSQTAANDALSSNLSQTVTSEMPSQVPTQSLTAESATLQPQVSSASEMQPTVASTEAFVRQLLSRWTLSPKELATPDKVKEFYQQLRENLLELRSALRFAQGKESADTSLDRLLSDTASATGQLQDNLEFMNMLNRIFPYVQLPIRFSDKTAHGELYVYTKKEKLRNESGSISVLLHLDMEALGPTDIYLSLSGSQLTSRFYLNDPSLEELFTGQLPELKETLTKKGFTVNFELVARRQEEDPVREFLNSHDDSGLSRFTFDCRA